MWFVSSLIVVDLILIEVAVLVVIFKVLKYFSGGFLLILIIGRILKWRRLMRAFTIFFGLINRLQLCECHLLFINLSLCYRSWCFIALVGLRFILLHDRAISLFLFLDHFFNWSLSLIVQTLIKIQRLLRCIQTLGLRYGSVSFRQSFSLHNIIGNSRSPMHNLSDYFFLLGTRSNDRIVFLCHATSSSILSLTRVHFIL